MKINQLVMESQMTCSECGGPAFTDLLLAEKKDACYYKVKASAKVWPSAYASGRLVQCRRKGAKNYGNKSEGRELSEGPYLYDGPGGVQKGIGGTAKYGMGLGDKRNMNAKNPEIQNDLQGFKSWLNGGPKPADINNMLTGVDTYFTNIEVPSDARVATALKQVLTTKQATPQLAQILTPAVDVAIKAPIRNSASGQQDYLQPGQAPQQAQTQTVAVPVPVPGQAQQPQQAAPQPAAATARAAGKKFNTSNATTVTPRPVARPALPMARLREQSAVKSQLDEKCWDGYSQQGMKKKGNRMVPNCVAAEAANPAQQAAIAINMKKKGHKPMNEYNAEYDDEAGMAQGSLHTMKNAVEGLSKIIDAGDNLPEWCQEKISLAEDYLVTVWDYIQSEKAQGMDPEIEAMYEAMEDLVSEMAHKNGVSEDLVWEQFEAMPDNVLYETAAWRRKEGKSKSGGLNRKGVMSYRREHPGSKLQTAVTTKPSKLKPGSKAAKRRKSFCARMSGVKGPMKKPNGKPTRKALALRKWNC